MTHPLFDVELDAGNSTSLSRQIADAVVAMIGEDRLGDDASLPSPADLAEALGVSVATVRSAYRRLSARGAIRFERGGPIRVIGSDVRSRRRGDPVTIETVGVVVPSRRTFYGPLLDGVHTAAGGATMTLVADSRDDPGRAMRAVRRLIEAGVGGIIAVGRSLPEEYGHRIAHRGPPIVYVDWDESPEPWVRFDRHQAAVVATTHLLEHGHRRIALVVPDPGRSPGWAIREGYREALKTAGIDADPRYEIAVPVYSYGAGRQAADTLARLDADAVFVGSDTIGAGAHATLTARGRIPGRDLGFVGLGGLELGRLLTPAMTTVALPRFAAGRHAMDDLIALAGGHEGAHTLLGGTLVPRRSCGCES